MIREFSSEFPPALNSAIRPALLALAVLAGRWSLAAQPAVTTSEHFTTAIRPLLTEFCLTCHSTEKHKGDLDLERFTSLTEVKKHPKIWQHVVEQVGTDEMPPKDKPQPTPAQRAQLLAWAGAVLDDIALARAGDPGPVVLRRLSNAEYTYTIRDLTDVGSLDPAREFPVDSASGEGFMNVGHSLVMSPALVTKYLDAGKDVTRHAVLLPDGIRFSAGSTRRDWTEELLGEIRAFYRQFTGQGGGTAVNLQGIKFDTKDGGVLPLEKYLAATLELREFGLRGQAERDPALASAQGALQSGRDALRRVPADQQFGPSGVRHGVDPVEAKAPSSLRSAGALHNVAARHNLSPKYLASLWTLLNSNQPSLLLDPIRARWRTAKPADVPALARDIAQWQQALWKFNSVGHIGKVGGPKAWMEPVNPLQPRQEIRLKLPASSAAKEVTLYLSASDAGDGNTGDYVVWDRPRLVAPGRPDLLLRDVRDVSRELSARRERILASTAKCLGAAAEAALRPGRTDVAELARKHGVEADALSAWFDYLGIGTGGPVRIEGYFTNKINSSSGYDFVKGWGSPETPNLAANSSDQHVRIPGNMKPHSVAVHPSPKLAAVVGWSSPVAGRVRVEAQIQHAHPECGNGVTWALELRRGATRQRLAAGNAQGSKEVKPAPVESLAVQPGDLVSLLIGPRDGNHSCDLTAVDLVLTSADADAREWNLARDVSADVLADNPHADRFGNEGVWHFYVEPDKGGAVGPGIPAGSLLAKWQSAASAEEKQKLADELEKMMTSSPPSQKDSPDATLYRQLASLGGPLFKNLSRSTRREEAPPEIRNPKSEIRNRESLLTSAATGWALDPARFGKHPNGSAVDAASLCVLAPQVIQIRLPADLVEGCEFVTTGSLHWETGREGSVQLQVFTNAPAAESGLVASPATVPGGKGTWTDPDKPVMHATPIVVTTGSAGHRRIEAALDEFRQIFPAALCYTKIVPVDEVVTLTLYHREDHHFARLLLDETQAARLDRLWDELHYVSHDALTLVDAFEQLWQYATQDADPKVFEPMRQPILQRAAAFRQRLLDTQPKHLDAVLKFADGAYRRPLADTEKEELRSLYRKLREEELPHDEAIRLTLARVLVAPAFLYKAEKPGPGAEPGPVSDWELATRLSYFLWSSAPDAELRDLAAKGRLRDPEVLVAQARRMLRDPRVRRLATEFACAWLHIYGFDELGEKSERHFPAFAGLRGPMYEESIRFFIDLFQRDGSVLNILDADYTFLNEALAKHYGIPDSLLRSSRREEALTAIRNPQSAIRNSQSLVTSSATTEDDGWRRVDGLKKYSRGGILGHATTLAKQSGASRTSPILRGNWVSEVLLGEKLPRPPKDVPRLPEDEANESLTVRQLTEKHSSDPKCYGCHRRIDPYGYALESFDAIGRHRERDLGDRPIETRAKTLDGAEIDGLDGLRNYLLTTRRDAFLKQFCRKLLGYSLGRGVQLSDGPLISEMRDQLKKHDYRITAAIEAIVRSKQFREIRGMEMAADE